MVEKHINKCRGVSGSLFYYILGFHTYFPVLEHSLAQHILISNTLKAEVDKYSYLSLTIRFVWRDTF